MKLFLPVLFCALLSACATTTRNNPPLPKLRSAMPQMPCQKPVWPREALRQQLKGTVTMKFLIDSDGHVIDKAIVRSSGYVMLDNAALEATARCKLVVASKNPDLQQEWVMTQYVWTFD